MKEDLRLQLRAVSGSTEGKNRVREYLQARILASLQRSGAMVPLAFQGGTALRFLFAIRRYSEDLDFALERPERGYDFQAYLRSVEADLKREGYGIEVKINDRRTVHGAFVRWPGLLFDLGLSPHPNEIFSIKVEVDTNPPAGAILATTVVRRSITLNLQHHDRASLFAGKLHAILQRPYPKGRDLYDLIWYASDPTWPSPNLALLNNALTQTGWAGPLLTESNWKKSVLERLRAIDWERAAADVQPFLEVPEELDLISEATAEATLADRV
jgi:hypothetical protein